MRQYKEYKIGDRVVITKDTIGHGLKIGVVGAIASEKIGRLDGIDEYVIEVGQKNIRQKENTLTRYFVLSTEFELIKKREISIISYDERTKVILKEDGKEIDVAYVEPYYKDPYSFEVGAQEGLRKLFREEKKEESLFNFDSFRYGFPSVKHPSEKDFFGVKCVTEKDAEAFMELCRKNDYGWAIKLDQGTQGTQWTKSQIYYNGNFERGLTYSNSGYNECNILFRDGKFSMLNEMELSDVSSEDLLAEISKRM